MGKHATFITITHPSQLKLKRTRRKVKSFVSKQHIRRAKKTLFWQPPLQPPCEDDVRLPQPLPPNRAPDDDFKDQRALSPIRGGPAIERDEGRMVAGQKQLVRRSIRSPPAGQLFPSGGNIQVPYLDTYPSKSTRPHLPVLLEYWFTQYGPSAVWRPELTGGMSNVDPFKQYLLHHMTAHPVFLEAILSISQASLDLHAAPESKAKPAVLQHRGRALVLIRERLLVHSATVFNDVLTATLLAMIAMAGLDLKYSDWTSFHANLAASRHLVRLRRSSANREFQIWFEAMMSWADTRWAAHLACSPDASRKIRKRPPTYPSHPFNPSVCRTIAPFPRGLREAALSASLSNEVISFLALATAWFDRLHDDDDAAAVHQQPPRDKSAHYLAGLELAVAATDLLATLRLNALERLLCFGALAFAKGITDSDRPGQLQIGLEDRLLGIEGLCSSETHADAVLWVGVVVAGLSPHFWSRHAKVGRWDVLDGCMDRWFGGEEWAEGERVVKEFFWTTSTLERWAGVWKVGLERWGRRKRGGRLK